jgi:osmotically-inducible protein OsmY
MHAILTPKRRITRLFNAARHPDQAAIVARIPVVGRRVPARGYWKQQRIDPKRIASRGVSALSDRAPGVRDRAQAAAASAAQAVEHRLPAVRDRATSATNATMQALSARLPAAQRRARTAAQTASDIAGETTKRGRAAIAHAPRNRFAIAAATFSLGALVMYFFDRASGRRRRALVRDRFAHIRRVLTRDVRRAAERRGRFVRGVARGVRHDAADLIPHGYRRVDDDTLVARVRSEVLRRADVPSGDIHIDVYEGCVTLRGQLGTDDEIHRVVERTRRVDGVADVRSYLHLPGTPPPNKAESLSNGHVPEHMLR